jgi:hypothetical protein
MRLTFAQKLGGYEVFNQKIETKHARPRKPEERRARVAISKMGREIEIQFSSASNGAQLGRGFLTLTEREVLLLANLCRRERTDDDFLKAIEAAGDGLTDVCRTHRRAANARGPG